jgi:hypothetical protein
MSDMLLVQVLGAFLGIQNRYWAIIIVVLLVILGLIYFSRGRAR